jgi:hypothetical protein
MTDWKEVWPESIDPETGEDADGVVRGPKNAGDDEVEESDDE